MPPLRSGELPSWALDIALPIREPVRGERAQEGSEQRHEGGSPAERRGRRLFWFEDPFVAQELAEVAGFREGALQAEQSFRELLTYMLEDSRNISRAIRLTFIGKYFERMADGATNICEMVDYLAEGKVIKHSNEPA